LGLELKAIGESMAVASPVSGVRFSRIAKKIAKVLSPDVVKNPASERWLSVDRRSTYESNRLVDQHDDSIISQSVVAVYEHLGLATPHVVVVDSPLEAVKAVYSHFDNKLPFNLHPRVEISGLCESAIASHQSEIMRQIGATCYGRLRALHGVSKCVYGGIDIDNAVYSTLADSGSAYHPSLSRRCGALSYYTGLGGYAMKEFATELGVVFEDGGPEEGFILSSAFCYPHDEFCVVSRNPKTIKWDNGRISCKSGPAVEYADGWKLWIVDGVPVDEDLNPRRHTKQWFFNDSQCVAS